MIEVEAKEVFGWLDGCGELSLRVQGNSMCPFLHDGEDTVTLRKPGTLRKGDIVVFERGGRYLMHRIVKISDGYIDTLGDNLSTPETRIPLQNVVAVVTGAVRRGKSLTPHSPLWLFFSRVYIHPAVRKTVRALWR